MKKLKLFPNLATYKGLIGIDFELPKNGIFVFGSNTEGRHGKGAALIAKQKYGAVYGQGMGPQGRSYGIITKDLTKKVHPSIDKEFIKDQINNLLCYALVNQNKNFYIAYSGKGSNLNGYTPKEMAEMFAEELGEATIDNVVFEEEFAKLMDLV